MIDASLGGSASQELPNMNDVTQRLAYLRAQIERMLAIAMADGMPEEFHSQRPLLEDLRDRIRKLQCADAASADRAEAEFLHHVECDPVFRRLYATAGQLYLLAVLGKQIDEMQDASQSAGLSDEDLETYSEFFRLLSPLVADVADDLRAGSEKGSV